ncbi:MAG: hypothetical protein KatS3mg115_0870 [Candidatus Poribacteria bacterium]|nr:MAG: hypothetical protein KatS3mg115_0870 [Candidatus Poribacteria bacterium]
MRTKGLGILIGGLLLATLAQGETGLFTDKERYRVGEPVTFILRNETDKDMTWGSISYYPTVWRIRPDGSEEIVRELPLIVLLALGVLPSGREKRWVWDQRDYYQWYDQVMPPTDPRKQVPPGEYLGRFETLTHGVFETDSFWIDEALPVDPQGKLTTTWAALKQGRF